MGSRKYSHWMYDPEVDTIVAEDDKERFLGVLSDNVDTVDMDLVIRCAAWKAKKCLLAMIQGEGCVPVLELYARSPQGPDPTIPIPIFPGLDPSIPTPAPTYPRTPTPLACVAYHYPEALDIIELLLSLRPDHANIKCDVVFDFNGPTLSPIDHSLSAVSHLPHLHTWALGDSLFKLIILLCQWESKSTLDCARLLAPHSDGLNDIAWSYVAKGWLASFAALLLVAPEKVLLPFESGLTIRQHIKDIFRTLLSEADHDHEGAIYQYMLTEACTLLDIFERAGSALRLYCSSMHEYVPPHEVLIDVARILKNAGYALEPLDIDLRDCYRKCPEIKKASVFKLSDSECPSNKYRLPSSYTWAQGFGAIIHSNPNPGNCQLLQKLKSGPVLNLKTSASEPRLISTAAGQVEKCGSGIPRKYLTYIAFKLKKGIKF